MRSRQSNRTRTPGIPSRPRQQIHPYLDVLHRPEWKVGTWEEGACDGMGLMMRLARRAPRLLDGVRRVLRDHAGRPRRQMRSGLYDGIGLGRRQVLVAWSVDALRKLLQPDNTQIRRRVRINQLLPG